MVTHPPKVFIDTYTIKTLKEMKQETLIKLNQDFHHLINLLKNHNSTPYSSSKRKIQHLSNPSQQFKPTKERPISTKTRSTNIPIQIYSVCTPQPYSPDSITFIPDSRPEVLSMCQNPPYIPKIVRQHTPPL